jgi:heme/copper-type cytochrome/quinol oxidase subunit 2
MPLPLADAIFGIAAVACAVAQWFILRGTLAASATPAAGDAVPTARRRAEIVWAVVPAIALAWVLAATWFAIHPPAPAPGAATAAAAP